MKKCSRCKEEKALEEFYNYKNGKQSVCKKCTIENGKQYFKKNKEKVYKQVKERRKTEKYKEYYRKKYALRRKNFTTEQTQNECFRLYKKGAKERNYSFELSIEQFLNFWNKPCSYCGDEIKTIGLDRMDNSVGYKISNITPCCSPCNRLKRGLNKEEFLERIKKIASFT